MGTRSSCHSLSRSALVSQSCASSPSRSRTKMPVSDEYTSDIAANMYSGDTIDGQSSRRCFSEIVKCVPSASSGFVGAPTDVPVTSESS